MQVRILSPAPPGEMAELARHLAATQRSPLIRGGGSYPPLSAKLENTVKNKTATLTSLLILFSSALSSGESRVPELGSQPYLSPDVLLDEWATLDADVTRVDEHPTKPDGLKITGFADGSYVRFGMQNPESSLDPLRRQRILMRINTSSKQDDRFVPLVNCKIYENGLEKLDLGTRPVTSARGELISFYWSSDILSNPSEGAEVELLITFYHQIHFFAVPLLDAVAWEPALDD